jgi:hypothetical protein
VRITSGIKLRAHKSRQDLDALEPPLPCAKRNKAARKDLKARMPVSFNVLVVQPSTPLPREGRGSHAHRTSLYTAAPCDRNLLPDSA